MSQMPGFSQGLRHSATNTALIAIIILIIWTTAKAIYNVYWHPLSRFPGPPLFAASRLPYVYTSFKGDLAWKLHRLHEQYGSVVRTAPNELSFIGTSAWKNIYDRSNKQQRPFRKNYDHFNEAHSQIRQSLYIADDDDHSRMRKVLTYAFSPEALRQQEPLLQIHVGQLMGQLDNERLEAKGVVDLRKWFMWVAFDIISDTSFGESYNCLVDPAYRPWPSLMSNIRGVITFVSGMKSILPYPQLLPATWILQNRINKVNFDLDKVRLRIGLRPKRSDLLSSIIHHNAQKGDMNNAEIMANASLFVLAGTETVATVLPALTFLLIKHPHVMRKLTAQIREGFEHESLISVPRLTQMEYLTACIEEALRIFPPVPEGLPRVVPPEGEWISGQ